MTARKNKHFGFTVRRKDGRWQACISTRLTGKGKQRKQLRFATETAAVAWGKKKVDELGNHGSEAATVNPREMRAFIDAIQKLQEKSLPLSCITEAVDMFIRQNDPERTRKTVQAAIEEFLLSRTNSGVAGITVRSYKDTLTYLLEPFQAREIHTISSAELEARLDELNSRRVTRANHRRHMVMLWNFAAQRKYAVENAASFIPKVNVKREKLPTILTHQQVRDLLNTARSEAMGRMVPYFAIGVFCGLRPEEIKRLPWSAIDFENKRIFVSPEVAQKTGADRNVPMPDSLIEWLKLTPQRDRIQTIYFTRHFFEQVRDKAGVLELWDNDIMRHAAASHLYAQTDSTDRVTSAMGHSLHVFLRYYKHTVTKERAEEYFSILPEDGPDGEASRQES